MNTHIDSLRFNRNPQTILMNEKRKRGLRVGAIGAAFHGFYVNSLATGAVYNQLASLLCHELNFKDIPSAKESFNFLINEGGRTTYNLLLPHLTAAKELEELKSAVEGHFFGVKQLIHSSSNLYLFLEYIRKNGKLQIEEEDLQLGILGWDMGNLVCLVRAAHETGYITEKEAWKYIEKAGETCKVAFADTACADKSFLLGAAMKSEKIEVWENLVHCYLLVREQCNR